MTGSGPEDCTLLRESAVRRDGLFGGLLVVFALALVRGVIGASTTSGRIAVVVIFGALVLAIFFGWRARRRRTNWLDVSADRIVLRDSTPVAVGQLVRASDDRLTFVVVGPVNARTLTLTIRGGSERLPLQFFKKQRVRELCVAYGWTFD
jgi:hypothetical protein